MYHRQNPSKLTSFYFLLISMYEVSHKANNYEVTARHFSAPEAVSLIFNNKIHNIKSYEVVHVLNQELRHSDVWRNGCTDLRVIDLGTGLR
jgi:hypothetical protein